MNIRDAGGRLQGYGTGSLVSPSLLLTNHHVLPDAETARTSIIEFNYQDGIDGRPLLAAGLRRSTPTASSSPTTSATSRSWRCSAAPGGAGAVRLQPPDRGRGQGDHRRVRDDRAAPARREEAGRAAREQDRRHPRAVPALRDRHGARLVRLAGVQRPVGGRRAAPRERAGARPRRARRVHERGHPRQPDPPVHARRRRCLPRCARWPTSSSRPRASRPPLPVAPRTGRSARDRAGRCT